MAFTVYCLTNRVTGKQYVGQTNNLGRRIREHRRASPHCIALSSAVKKYGWSSFELSVLAYATLDRDVDSLEVQYICELNTLAPNGYNLVSGGRVNHQASSETLERRREASRITGFRGKKHTPETKLKISNALKGRDVSGGAERLKAYWAKPENAAKRNAGWTPERRKKQGDVMRERMKRYHMDNERAVQ